MRHAQHVRETVRQHAWIARELAGNPNRRNRPRIAATTEPDDIRIAPTPREVTAGDEWFVWQHHNLTLLRLEHAPAIDELRIFRFWWDTAHADAEAVTVLAVILLLLGDELLVREAAGARVDDPRLPALPLTAEDDVVKRAAAPRGVAKQELHRLAVRESALLDFVNHIRHVAVFVVDVVARAGDVVLTRERFGVIRVAGLRRALPRFALALAIHDARVDFEPVRGNPALDPCEDRRPGFILELCVRVRGDDTFRIAARGHQETREHPGERALPDAVAARDRGANRHHGIDAVELPLRDFVAEPFEKLALPNVRLSIGFEGTWLAPVERATDVAERIRIHLAAPVVEFGFEVAVDGLCAH